jgi:hypothetical protein
MIDRDGSPEAGAGNRGHTCVPRAFNLQLVRPSRLSICFKFTVKELELSGFRHGVLVPGFSQTKRFR